MNTSRQPDSTYFASNRKNLLAVTQVDLIMVSANAQLQSSADMAFRFRQDSHFWYLTGILSPEAVLVIDTKTKKEIILIPEPNDYTRVFEGASGIEEASRVSGVSNVFWYNEGWSVVQKLLKKAKTVGMTLPHEQYIDTYTMYANPARENLLKNLRKYDASVDVVDIRMELARLRMIKSPLELDLLQQAIDITIQGFNAITKSSFRSEYEVEAELSRQFRSLGADGHGYEPIVASAKNACTLHYSENSDQLRSGDSLLIDAGARKNYFTADISRTFSVGEPSKRLQDVWASVDRATKRCQKLLKPGIFMRDYMLSCDEIVGEELIRLGLIKNNVRAEIRKYYPHSTSHFLGIDAHDAGDYDMPLQINSVLTIEPGIYIPEENIGVRIEDNFVLTENGCRNLSGALSTELRVMSLKKS